VEQVNTIAERFKSTPEHINTLLEQVSMNFGNLERYLETKDKDILWNLLEDRVLQ